MYIPGSAERASSLDHLCSQQSPGLSGQRSRYTKNRREAECAGELEGEEGLMSPTEEDGGGYGAFTLPCRRSHCLSEGLAGLSIPAAPCPAFQGRRAQTTQVRAQQTLIRFKVLFCCLSLVFCLLCVQIEEPAVLRTFMGSKTVTAWFNNLLTTRDISCACSCSVVESVCLFVSRAKGLQGVR